MHQNNGIVNVPRNTQNSSQVPIHQFIGNSPPPMPNNQNFAQHPNASQYTQQ